MKLIRIAAISLFAGLATFTNAQVSDTPPVVTKDEQFAIINARDFDRMQAVISETHDMTRTGDATIGDLRVKFELFWTSNPDTIAFVRDWVQAYPRSPYPHAAQAWVSLRVGWDVRGDLVNARTYPDALEYGFATLDDGFNSALRAYSLDGSFVPATDALLSLAMSANDREIALQANERIMAETPNWGTLSRMTRLANPKFGGTENLGLAICEHFGQGVDWPERDNVRHCKIMVARNYYGQSLKTELKGWLAEEASDEMDHHRIQDIIYRGHNGEYDEEELKRAEAYFRDGSTFDYEHARKYDLYIGVRYERAPLEQHVLTRAKERARKILKQDPYNI